MLSFPERFHEFMVQLSWKPNVHASVSGIFLPFIKVILAEAEDVAALVAVEAVVEAKVVEVAEVVAVDKDVALAVFSVMALTLLMLLAALPHRNGKP